MSLGEVTKLVLQVNRNDVGWLISEIKLQSIQHLPFLLNSPSAPMKVPSVPPPSGWTLQIPGPETGRETCRDRDERLFLPREVFKQEREAPFR